MKELIRKFFVLTICFSLINLTMVIPIQSAQAQEQAQVYDMGDGTDTDAKMSPGMISALTLLLAGYVGFKSWTSCTGRSSPSMIAFYTTSVAYLYAEVSAYMKYKKAAEKRLAVDISKKLDTQIKSFEEVKKSTEEVLARIEGKLKNMKIIRAGYAAAVGLAAYEGLTVLVSGGKEFIVTCTAPPNRAANDAKYEKLSHEGKAECLTDSTCNGGLSNSQKSGDAWIKDSAKQVPKSKSISIPKPGQSPSVQPTIQEEYYKKIPSDIYQGRILKEDTPLKQYTKHNLAPNTVKTMLMKLLKWTDSALFPKAHAEYKKSTTAAVTIIGALAIIGGVLWDKITLGLWHWIAPLLSHSWGRMLAFGAFAGIAENSIRHTKRQIKRLKTRIAEYDGIIIGLQNIEKATGIAGPGEEQINVEVASIMDGSTQQEKIKTCFAGGGADISVDNGCSCLTTREGCASIDTPNLDLAFPNFSSIASPLATGMNNAINMGNDLAMGGLGTGSLTGVDGNLNAIRKVNKKLEDTINKKRKKPIDFEKARAGFLNEMQKAVLKTIKDNGGWGAIKDQGMFASISAAPASAQEKRVAKMAKKIKAAIASKEKGQKENDPFANLDLGLEENITAQEILDDDMPASKDVFADLEISDDISMKKGVSIFKVLSTRYLKTAYPSLLDKE